MPSSPALDADTLAAVAEVTRRVLVDNARPRPGDAILVVAEESTAEIGRAFHRAALDLDEAAALMVMPMLSGHGAEPPADVAAAMLRADLIVSATTHAISHSEARRRASAAGARTFVLRSITVDTLLNGGINADYREIAEVTERLAARMARADRVRVTSALGTDVAFSVAGRRAFAMGGVLPEAGGVMAGVPSGEAAISPAEGTASGVIVIDHFIDDVGPLSAPVRLRIVDGRVASVEDGPHADAVRAIIGRDEHAGNLAEFAIGTNPASRLLGNGNEDKLKRGCVHFGLGDNLSTLHGKVASVSHVDATMLAPTVSADGEVLVDEGALAPALVAP